jgi:hypothetical protein
MGIRLTGIPAPFIKPALATRDNLDWFVLGGIHIPPGSSNGAARLFRVNAELTVVDLAPLGIGTAGKDDSMTLKVLPNGVLRVILCEAGVTLTGASDSGSTTLPAVYDFPGVFPAYATSGGAVDSVARAAIEGLKKYLRTTP